MFSQTLSYLNVWLSYTLTLFNNWKRGKFRLQIKIKVLQRLPWEFVAASWLEESIQIQFVWDSGQPAVLQEDGINDLKGLFQANPWPNSIIWGEKRPFEM